MPAAPQAVARPGAEAHARLPMLVTPAGSVAAIRTTNVNTVDAPAGSAPIAAVHVEPAVVPAQTQAAELPTGTYVVRPGTASLTVTLAAPWLPVFWTAIE